MIAYPKICVLCGASHTVYQKNARGLFCPDCKTPQLVREADRVRYYVGFAARRNLPATLTLLEWLDILDHFKWKCAYGIGQFEIMEHIIPITGGGGTTALNVVPGCLGCNTHKDRVRRPTTFPISQEKIDEIRNELEYLVNKRRSLHAQTPIPGIH